MRTATIDGHARLRALMQDGGQNATVLVLGGSVAAAVGMAGGGAAERWVSWLTWRSKGQRSFRVVNHAHSGTNVFWAINNLDELVTGVEPDMVLVDYSSNDFFSDGTAATKAALRAAHETLVRSLLRLPSRPAVIILALLRGFTNPAVQYLYQEQVYEPVARHYGQPLVSFRDVIWPDRHFIPDDALFATGTIAAGTNTHAPNTDTPRQTTPLLRVTLTHVSLTSAPPTEQEYRSTPSHTLFK